jgi:predicted nucleic acid-binding protein
MDSSDGSYLFDVGVIALAHTDAPVRDTALDYVKAGISGEIDAVVPYPAVIGAHHVLTAYYGHTNEAASRLLQNFLDATRIHWYDGVPRDIVRDGLSLAGDVDVGGWDGYYAAVATAEDVNTVLTIDDDFERFDAFDTEVILSPEQYRELNAYLGH